MGFRHLLLISLLFPFRLPSFEGKIDSREPIQPWFTGPILATSGNIVPKGHAGTQPYIFAIARTSFYDETWSVQPIDTLWSLQFRTPVWIGLSSRIDFKVSPVWMWNHRKDQSQWTLGDLSMQLNFQLYKESLPNRNWLPSMKIGIAEIFPTGKYEQLNPNRLGTDGGGRGSYTTVVSFNASKMFHLSQFRFLSFRLNLGCSIPTNVSVKGFNYYGGGINTKGVVFPGDSLFAIVAFEYSLNRNWAVCADFQGSFGSKTSFQGTPGVIPSQEAELNPAGIAASNENKASIQYTAAPGIEYNWSENLGLVTGVWMTLAGKNSSSFISGVFSINYYH